MILISIAAFAMHSLVVLRSINFFVAKQSSRDQDKAIVAALGVLSFLYLGSQVYTAFTDPNILMTTRVSLRVGFDAALGFVMFATVVDKAEVRQSRAAH